MLYKCSGFQLQMGALTWELGRYVSWDLSDFSFSFMYIKDSFTSSASDVLNETGIAWTRPLKYLHE